MKITYKLDERKLKNMVIAKKSNIRNVEKVTRVNKEKVADIETVEAGL